MENTCTSDTSTVRLQATVGSCELKMGVTVPAGPTRLDDLMPLLQILSDKVVSAAEQDAQQQGQCISCKKGCGACCRQLVPLSPVEARHVARLVEAMPQPRQSQIRERFAAARQKLEAAGVWQKLNERRSWPEDGVSKIGLEYFQQQVPCPFLEDESCSIHLDRPMTCREYLVTSPAENCANPTPQNIEWLPIAAKVWVAAARCEPPADGGPYVNWIPLIQALDWAADNEEAAPDINGPDLVKRVIENLANSGNERFDARPAAATA
jgi:Fe-S-cluster containining protein